MIHLVAIFIVTIIFISTYIKSTHQHTLLSKSNKTTTISTDECYLCKISNNDDFYFENSKLNQFVFVEKIHFKKHVKLIKFNLSKHIRSRAPPLT